MRERKFDADGEQEQHDADLGHHLDLFDVRDEIQAVRTDERAGGEKPGDGGETELVEDEHDPDGDRENHQQIGQGADVGHDTSVRLGTIHYLLVTPKFPVLPFETVLSESGELPSQHSGPSTQDYPMPLRAIIFDFNGVIADDETPHFLMFQQALREEGLPLNKEDYYGAYLGMDERNCLAALLKKTGRAHEPELGQRIHERKVALFRDYTARHPPVLFPGVADFVLRAKERYRIAVASGGKREQIAAALRGTPIERAFPLIVAAEDTTIGKPDPHIYRLTLEKLNALAPKPDPPIAAADCLVIEDSLAGIQSAKAAGMKVIGLATTYPMEKLKNADAVYSNLTAVGFPEIERLCEK